MKLSFWLLLGNLLCLSACSYVAEKSQNPALPTPVALPLVLVMPNYPLSVQDRPTTDGKRFLANLQGRLAGLPAEETPHTRAVRAGVLYQQYQILGALKDLDAAYALARELSADPQTQDDVLLLDATIAAYMHEFERALSLLKRLANPLLGNSLHAEITAARSQPPLLDAPRQLTEGQEYAQLIELGHACVDRGDLACASGRFHEAQFAYHDVAPLPLAWLHTQQGIALLRFGHPEQAIRFFRSALARLPGYYLALEHLAECLALTGQYAEGRAAYQQVIAQTDNPEFFAGLADLESRAGNRAAAEQLREKAKAGYELRLAKYPAAYAQHAVGFFLEIGELERALALAKDNLTLRQDASAYLLLAEVQLAQGDLKNACASIAPVRASGRNPPELHALENSLPGCLPSR